MMKGQFIFEFLVAGLLFFAVVLYSINYMNTNVRMFSANFYQDWLNDKVVQISEMLMNEHSPVSLVSDANVFNQTKIQDFQNIYCNENSYAKMINDFGLHEKREYGLVMHDISITLNTSNNTIFTCGKTPALPSASIERLGLLNGKISKLTVTVW